MPHPNIENHTLATNEPQKDTYEAMISSLTNKIRELESRCACFKDGSTRNSFTKVEPTIAKKLADTKTRFIDSKFVESKGRRIDIEVEEFIDEDSHETRQPITAKRIFSDDNTRIEKTQIIISSTGLGNLLRDVLDRYLKHEFQSIFDKNEIVLSNPFIPLEHNWELLQNATTEKKVLQKHGRECVSELKELLNLVHRWAPECTQMWSAIRDSKTVMKEHLYSMFKPGNLVVAMHSDNYAQLMKVHHYGAGSTANLSGTSSVFCEGFDWNGRKLERLRYEFSMPEMESTEQFKVRDLPCCPVEFYEDERGANGIEDLKKSLIKRGQRFEEVCIAQHERKRTYNYLGKFQVEGGLRPSTWPSIFSPQDLADPVRSNLKRISTPPAFLTDAKQVVIDPRSFHEYGPREARNGLLVPQARVTPCNCPLCISNETKDWMASFGKPRDLKDVDDYALLPPRVLGFALDHKLWGQFFIDRLDDTEKMNQAFDEGIVLPNINKETMQDLIKNHRAHEVDHITDFIDGKGRGLVLLFHGPPGVGKTSTAETLAESCRKILLPVGIGDLGTEAETVEVSLRRLFRLVIAWDGILLIDEADVFLDARGSKGEVFPEQNAMVSVLLRLLEYFPGVLILTTNRVTSIDYAIMSRISYAVNFKELTVDHQISIYQKFLDQAERKNSIGAGEKEKLLKFAKRSFKENKKLNGRDIRTLFTTAQVLGNGKLTAEIMAEVHEQQQNFKDDMKTLYLVAEGKSIVH